MRLCECGCGRQVHQKRSRFAWGHSGRTGKSASYPKRGKHGKAKDIHRIRAESALGKPLPVGAQVHHSDGSKDADAQLVICQDQHYHALLHRRQKVKDFGGNPNIERWCGRYQKLKLYGEFNLDVSKSDGLSNLCRSCQRVKWERYQPHRRSKNAQPYVAVDPNAPQPSDTGASGASAAP